MGHDEMCVRGGVRNGGGGGERDKCETVVRCNKSE